MLNRVGLADRVAPPGAVIGGWNLDRATAASVFELKMPRAAEQGTAFIVVTPDTALAARCNQTLTLQR